MEKFFKLDPYHNVYRNNSLPQQLRHELLKYKASGLTGITGSLDDYTKIQTFLEKRFTHDLKAIFKDEFGIDYRLIEIPLNFDDNLFHSQNLFYNERYGQYINMKLNELLMEFGIQIEYSRKHEMIYNVFIDATTNNSDKYSANWNMYTKHMLKINSIFEYFMKKFAKDLEDTTQLYYDDNKKIYDQMISIKYQKSA